MKGFPPGHQVAPGWIHMLLCVCVCAMCVCVQCVCVCVLN